MRKCPNCGQETARTEDWACQWCAYPLLSESYQKIPKTFKQLKEERLHKVEIELEPAAEKEERAQKGAERLAKEKAKQEYLAWRDAEKLSRERVKQEAKEARERTKREKKAKKEAEKQEREEARRKAKEARAQREAERQVKGEAEREPEPETELVPEPAEEQKPEPMVEPVLESVAAIIELNVEELSSTFRADEMAAHEKFTNSIIKLTGNVDKIVINDINNNYYITFASGEKMIGLRDVQCKFNKKDVPELKMLIEGDKVTVQGKYAGYVIDILMRHCAFVR